MAFFRLFRRIILRHFRYEWGKLALSVAGVALGVTVFTAVRLANTTAFQAFTESLDAVAGKANLQVLSNDGLGFDEAVIADLRCIRVVDAAAPVVEQYAQVEDSLERADPGSGRPILVLGIDIFAEAKFRDYAFDAGSAGARGEGLRFLLEPDAIVITTVLADRYGLERGDSIPLIAGGKRLLFRITGLVEPSGTAAALDGNFALLDIASAQEAFNRPGKIDRIDLLVPEERREDAREYLGTRLPEGVLVQEPRNRGAQVERMLESFDLNLTALAFIALFTAMFIIYNTMLTNTLRRRRELGIMRAVGAGRGEITGLFLAEAALIGLLGTLIGLPLGVALAEAAVAEVTRTVTALYILTVAENVILDPMTLLLGGLLGPGVSMLSALPPALEAARAHPRETFSVQTFERRVRLNYPRILSGALVAGVLAWGASQTAESFASPWLGFLGAGFVLVGFALTAPVFITLANRLLGRAIKKVFGVEGELANAYLLASLGRSSTAVAALMTAIAMLVGVSTMIGSFRETVEYWMRRTITADLYLTTTGNRLTAVETASFPPEILAYVDSLPQVPVVDVLKRIRVGYAGRWIVVSGARLNMPEEQASLSFREGEWSRAMKALDTGDIVVSEGLARRFGKEMGDTITLETRAGSVSPRIAGIYYDYSAEGGSAILRREAFVRMFGDPSVTSVALYFNDTVDIAPTRELLERRFGGRFSLLVYSNRSLRDEALRIFDQTFSITYALQLVAIIVAAIGVANALAALAVERGREIGILKAVGAVGRQVRKMILVQAGLIAIASQTLGILAGLVLSWVLIYVINLVSFGWTIQMVLSPEVLLLSTLLVMVTALLSGLGPAAAAARRSVAEAVKME